MQRYQTYGRSTRTRCTVMLLLGAWLYMGCSFWCLTQQIQTCRPFRAPELLFGATTYDACATDLWSLGCTIAHFYTPLRLSCRSYLDEGDEDEGEGSKWREDAAPDPFLLPKSTDSIDLQSAEWVRESLFDGNMGSIGLAWSTFTLRGTPNDTNWPVRLFLTYSQAAL